MRTLQDKWSTGIGGQLARRALVYPTQHWDVTTKAIVHRGYVHSSTVVLVGRRSESRTLLPLPARPRWR